MSTHVLENHVAGVVCRLLLCRLPAAFNTFRPHLPGILYQGSDALQGARHGSRPPVAPPKFLNSSSYDSKASLGTGGKSVWPEYGRNSARNRVEPGKRLETGTGEQRGGFQRGKRECPERESNPHGLSANRS